LADLKEAASFGLETTAEGTTCSATAAAGFFECTSTPDKTILMGRILLVTRTRFYKRVTAVKLRNCRCVRFFDFDSPVLVRADGISAARDEFCKGKKKIENQKKMRSLKILLQPALVNNQ
jgi:hypothetical protein